MLGRLGGTIARGGARLVRLLVLAHALGACGETTDSLGSNGAQFAPLRGPDVYPNALRDVLDLSEAEIDDKIQRLFDLLFMGNPETEAIYFSVSNERARIEDIFHGDVRTEGMGLGMMIAVQLGEREYFDKLWTYSKEVLAYRTGANRGYFRSYCGPSGTEWVPCADPFGHQQFAMALLFANNRWGSRSGRIDYAADAWDVLHVMRNKQAENGGIVSGVTNMFDTETKLVFDKPHLSAIGITRPSIEMPAYYELWAQATGDDFWRAAASSAREHWQASAHAVTGLTPAQARFDGTPVSEFANFSPESYRVQINLALDQIWFDPDDFEVELSDRLLRFFLAQGIDRYGATYTLEGVPVDPNRELALIVVNGVTAQSATIAERDEFIRAAWEVEIVGGEYRYYRGLLDLLSLLILSGRFRVH